MESIEPTLESEGAEGHFPWPPAEHASAVTQLGRTWQESVFQPARFFAALPRGSVLGGAVVYYLIIGTAAAAVRLFWRMTFAVVLPESDSALMRAIRMGDPESPLVEFLLAPVVLLLTLGLAAVITHFSLWIVGGVTRPLSTTTAVLAYSAGPQLFAVVPVLGTLVGSLWTLVLWVIGLREAHGTSTGRAVVAVLLPVLALMGLFVLLLVALLAIGGTGLLIPDLPA